MVDAIEDPQARDEATIWRPAARGAAAGVATALIGLALAACGTPSPDLFVVNRDGTVPGARLELLVSDQTARCNDGPARRLTSGQIIEARDIRRDLVLLQNGDESIPKAPPAQIFTFAVQTEQGTLRYPDTQQRPAVLPRLSRFVRRVAIDTCGLQRETPGPRHAPPSRTGRRRGGWGKPHRKTPAGPSVRCAER